MLSTPASSNPTTPLLSVEQLCVAFGQGEQRVVAVESVSFTLQANRTLALVGESGSGKSVTALSILRLLDRRAAHYPQGRILFDGEDLLTLAEPALRKIRGNRISVIFQEPMTSLNPLHTVGRQIMEVLALHRGLRGPKARARATELLTLVGIRDPESRLEAYPHQLSGGQKQRVMIAMALANEPDLLIADEPTTALDVTVQKQVLELLAHLQKRLGMAVLLISHDLAVVRQYADDVVVMRHGRVMESGPCDQLFKAPQHPYTRELLQAEPERRLQPVSANAKVRLSTERLGVRFGVGKTLFGRDRSQFIALQNTSFMLRQGETLGIVGESGSGKTTLGLALLKLLRSEGEIRLDGKRIDGLGQKAFRPLRRKLQVVFQDPYGSLSPRMTIAQIVGEGLEIHEKLSTTAREQKICEALEDVGLDPAARHRYPHEFSGGQRQRIAIARALVLRPDVIILDEPTSALDRTVQRQVVELLQTLQQRYALSYIFISHDLAVVRALSHQLIVLKDGQVVEQGPAERIFAAPRHSYTRTLLDAAFFYHASPDATHTTTHEPASNPQEDPS